MSAHVVKLSKPLKGDDAFGEAVAELKLREPTGDDLVKLRLPVVGGQIDEDRMAAWIAELSGLPRSAVGKLVLKDWMAAAGVISGFFEA